MSRKLLGALIAAMVFLAGCQTTGGVVSDNPMVNPDFAEGGHDGRVVSNSDSTGMDSFGLGTEDFEFAAHKAVTEFLESPAGYRSDGGRWVVSIGEVINDTTFRVDTRSMTSRMRNKLINSGRFSFTGATGQDRTDFVSDTRQLRRSANFDQSTVARQGTVIAPDLELSGMIRQRTNVSGNRKQQRLEYEFDFRAVDSYTGMIVFSTLVDIKKVGSNKNFAW